MAWPTEAGSLGLIDRARGSRARAVPRPRSKFLLPPPQTFPLSYEQTRHGLVSRVRAISGLAGKVFYYWWVDGRFAGMTASSEFEILLPLGDQARVECVASNDASLDVRAAGPATPPARELIWWIGSGAAGVASYRVEQASGGGAWSEIAGVAHDPDQWEYRVFSTRLDDLTDYAWRVVPVDAAGNDGVPVVLPPRRIVRTPDAPACEIAFDEGSARVTFSAA